MPKLKNKNKKLTYLSHVPKVTTTFLMPPPFHPIPAPKNYYLNKKLKFFVTLISFPTLAIRF
jgi:hypothetical protein